MKFNEYMNRVLNEGVSISIGQLNTLEDPVYVLIAGGVGAGKSYVLSKNTSKAMAITKKKVLDMLDSGESFIHMGTSANLNATINKLKVAKDKGFTTVLLFIDTPPEQAIENNKERVTKGGRGDTIPDHKFQRTYDGAKNTFDNLKNDDLVDYVIHYDNRR